MRVPAGSAALRLAPDGSAEQVNQALFGEPVTVFDRDGEWAYVQLGHRSLCRLDAAGRASRATRLAGSRTHRVPVLRTFIYERAGA